MLLLSGGWPYEILEPGPISTQGTGGGADGFPQDSQGRGDSGPALDPLISATFDRLDSLNNFLDYKRGAELYQPLSDVANMLGYTLYPVDVPGVSSRPAGADVTVDRYGDTTTFSTESANESSLRLLADETGGQALINDLRLQAVDRVSEDTSSYYWLGFQVDRRGDDQRHQIELTTRNPRLRVRTRQSFTDLSRRTESRMSAEEALIVDTLRGTELVIRAEGVEPQSDKLVRVGLQIEIPSDDITILPTDEGYDIDLELTLIAIDQRAAFWDLAAIPIQRHLPSQPPAGVIFRHRFAVTLPQGARNLAVALQDLPSGRVMAGRLPIEP